MALKSCVLDDLTTTTVIANTKEFHALPTKQGSKEGPEKVVPLPSISVGVSVFFIFLYYTLTLHLWAIFNDDSCCSFIIIHGMHGVRFGVCLSSEFKI